MCSPSLYEYFTRIRMDLMWILVCIFFFSWTGIIRLMDKNTVLGILYICLAVAFLILYHPMKKLSKRSRLASMLLSIISIIVIIADWIITRVDPIMIIFPLMVLIYSYGWRFEDAET